jgi:hypothetical protein
VTHPPPNTTTNSLFQIIVINFQLRASATNNRANLPAQADLSIDRARGDFALFAPAPTAVLFTFFVFGTTRTFREYMWRVLVPRALRERVEARKKRAGAGAEQREGGGSVSVVHSSVVRAGDVEGGEGGMGVGLRDLGPPGRRGEGDGTSDEWPILKGGSLVGVGRR